MPNSTTIPVISISDELVDDFKRPTMKMSLFFMIITKTVKFLLDTKIDDAPADGNTYARKDNTWVQI